MGKFDYKNSLRYTKKRFQYIYITKYLLEIFWILADLTNILHGAAFAPWASAGEGNRGQLPPPLGRQK